MNNFCKLSAKVILAALMAGCLVLAADSDSAGRTNVDRFLNMERVSDVDVTESEADNKLIPYEPLFKRKRPFTQAEGGVIRSQSADNNVIKSRLYPDLERELQVAASSNNNPAPESDFQLPDEDVGRPVKSLTSPDKIDGIAFNAQEVRLVGAEKQPVFVKDDLASQVAVAWDNIQKEATAGWDKLQKEASVGWDVARERIDKGWTDFKTMVEGVVDPKKKRTSVV